MPPFARAAETTLDEARAAVIRNALSVAAPGVVTIETVGGAQPLDGSDASGHFPDQLPSMPGEQDRRLREAEFRFADGPTTGVIWSADGYIITSSINFARSPTVITVAMNDGARHVAKLLGVDFIRRLALLKIDAKDLPLPTWLTTDALRIGQNTIAIGRGLDGPVPALSLGILSALNRRNGSAVQTDAKISPINYGGPLIDIEGRVIGILVPMAGEGNVLAGPSWYDSGIGFAIPRSRIESVIERLKAGEIIEPGKIGIILEHAPLEDEPEDAGFPPRLVVQIKQVARESPGARAGLLAGDKILGLNGEPAGDIKDVQRRLSDRAAGEKVTLTIQRVWRRLEIEVTLARPRDIKGLEPLAPTTQATQPGEDDGEPKQAEPPPSSQPAPD